VSRRSARPHRSQPPRSKGGWTIPRSASLYADASSPDLRIREVSDYLKETLGFACFVRRDFFVEQGGDLEALARALASVRVRHIGRPFEAMEPLFGEVQFELRLLRDPAKRVPGVLYDAFRYADLLRGLLPPSERSFGTFHLAFAHRLLGTFDEDGRYHARTVVCSVPSVISTSGLVEAPARPPEYYTLKARLSMALGSVPFETAKEKFAGQFLDYDDPRLTEVAKGYALQAAVYHVTKEAFCEIPTCRLFNAHWQSELLASQIESGRLCDRHVRLATKIRSLSRAQKG